MNWLRYVFVLLLGALGSFGSPTAHAQATCTITGSGLSFGSVDPWAANEAIGYIAYECSAPGNGKGKESAKPVSIQMCLGLGYSAPTERRMDNIDGDQLRFQLYTPPAPGTAVWGETIATDPPYYEVPLFTIPGGSVPTSGSVAVYARTPLLSGQAAGPYASTIAGTLSYGYKENGNPKKLDCLGNGGQGSGTGSFQFTADATVLPSCTVVTASDMDFSPGGMPLYSSSTGDLTSTSTINLTCTERTAWQVGLNRGLTDNRQMCNPGGACITYQLAQQNGAPWGNTEDTDTAVGTGTGADQVLVVNGSISDQPLTQAGRYSDTVTVTLTY